jgi:type IV pilus assembly protein PilX
MQHRSEFRNHASTRPERGFVLVTALIFLVVLSVLGVMAMRGSFMEEKMSSNDRERAVAREYAELALRDAERDILGLRFDGTYCSAAPCATLRPAGTRPANTADAGNFWIAANPAVDDVALDDGGRTEAIERQGVYTNFSAAACGMPVWEGANWVDGANPARSCAGTIANPIPTIAYGTFTEAPFAGANGVPPPRYMIEMFKAGDLQGFSAGNKLFFRITAVGFGQTVSPFGGRTSVTLQSVFSPL